MFPAGLTIGAAWEVLLTSPHWPLSREGNLLARLEGKTTSPPASPRPRCPRAPADGTPWKHMGRKHLVCVAAQWERLTWNLRRAAGCLPWALFVPAHRNAGRHTPLGLCDREITRRQVATERLPKSPQTERGPLLSDQELNTGLALQTASRQKHPVSLKGRGSLPLSLGWEPPDLGARLCVHSLKLGWP